MISLFDLKPRPTGGGGSTGATGPAGLTGATGPTGATGLTGLRAFAFSSSRVFENQYKIGEIVFYADSHWICIADNDALIPSTSPSYWSPYSFIGDTGPTGATGVPGPTGATGLIDSDYILSTFYAGTLINDEEPRNINLSEHSLFNFSSDATGNYSINFRADASTSLNSFLTAGEYLSCEIAVKNGATAYNLTSLTVDGSAPSNVFWEGEESVYPTGTANTLDVYAFKVLKLADNSFQVNATKKKVIEGTPDIQLFYTATYKAWLCGTSQFFPDLPSVVYTSPSALELNGAYVYSDTSLTTAIPDTTANNISFVFRNKNYLVFSGVAQNYYSIEDTYSTPRTVYFDSLVFVSGIFAGQIVYADTNLTTPIVNELLILNGVTYYADEAGALASYRAWAVTNAHTEFRLSSLTTLYSTPTLTTDPLNVVFYSDNTLSAETLFANNGFKYQGTTYFTDPSGSAVTPAEGQRIDYIWYSDYYTARVFASGPTDQDGTVITIEGALGEFTYGYIEGALNDVYFEYPADTKTYRYKIKQTTAAVTHYDSLSLQDITYTILGPDQFASPCSYPQNYPFYYDMNLNSNHFINDGDEVYVDENGTEFTTETYGIFFIANQIARIKTDSTLNIFTNKTVENTYIASACFSDNQVRPVFFDSAENVMLRGAIAYFDPLLNENIGNGVIYIQNATTGSWREVVNGVLGRADYALISMTGENNGFKSSPSASEYTETYTNLFYNLIDHNLVTDLTTITSASSYFITAENAQQELININGVAGWFTYQGTSYVWDGSNVTVGNYYVYTLAGGNKFGNTSTLSVGVTILYNDIDLTSPWTNQYFTYGGTGYITDSSGYVQTAPSRYDAVNPSGNNIDIFSFTNPLDISAYVYSDAFQTAYNLDYFISNNYRYNVNVNIPSSIEAIYKAFSITINESIASTYVFADLSVPDITPGIALYSDITNMGVIIQFSNAKFRYSNNPYQTDYLGIVSSIVSYSWDVQFETNVYSSENHPTLEVGVTLYNTDLLIAVYSGTYVENSDIIYLLNGGVITELRYKITICGTVYYSNASVLDVGITLYATPDASAGITDTQIICDLNSDQIDDTISLDGNGEIVAITYGE